MPEKPALSDLCACAETSTRNCPVHQNQGDSMPVMRHWTLRWVEPEITIASPSRPNALVIGPGVRWHGEEVEVIPFADARGAVAAGDNFKIAVVDALRYAKGERKIERLWDAVEEYKEARDALGGQS